MGGEPVRVGRLVSAGDDVTNPLLTTEELAGLRAMLSQLFTLDEIAECFGLTKEHVMRLAKEMAAKP